MNILVDGWGGGGCAHEPSPFPTHWPELIFICTWTPSTVNTLEMITMTNNHM